MLTDSIIEMVLTTVPHRTVGVLGDVFLDRYLDLDASLTEPSIETGLDAYQVVNVRSYPGAAGTVVNNLASLGVGRIVPISMIGDDGEGYELHGALKLLPRVDLSALVTSKERRTPTYTKPMLGKSGECPRELNRIDIKNRQPLPPAVEARILELLKTNWRHLNVLLVLDQVSEPDCGVVTRRVRECLALLSKDDADKIVVVDSRERIDLFRNAWLKPNERECLRAAGPSIDLADAIRKLSRRTQRPVICTQGSRGILVAETESEPVEVTAYPVTCAIDTVGAGDSSSAAIACALASGAKLVESAAFGNLVASITIQQIGVTGSASPEQVRRRWMEVNRR